MSNINSPKHYAQLKTSEGNIECIDIIEGLGLNFNTGNAMKYLWRHQFKGKPVEDLKKCIYYLQRELY